MKKLIITELAIGAITLFLLTTGQTVHNAYANPQFHLLDRKRIKDVKLTSLFEHEINFGNPNVLMFEPSEYDFEEITRKICSIEGTSMEIYNDIGTPTTYCGIPAKNEDWTYQDYFWSANSHLRKTAKIILDIYGNVSPEAMEGLLSWDYNTPQTRPALRNPEIIQAIKDGNREFVAEYMAKYNTPQVGHEARRENELNLIFNQ